MRHDKRPIPAHLKRGNDLRLAKDRPRKWGWDYVHRKCCPACALRGVRKEARRHAWAKGYCKACASARGFTDSAENRRHKSEQAKKRRLELRANGQAVVKKKKAVVKGQVVNAKEIIANSKASKPKANAKARESKPKAKGPKPTVFQERSEPEPFQGSWSDAIRATGHHLRRRNWPKSVVFVRKLPSIIQPIMDRPQRRARGREIDVPEERMRLQYAMELAELSMEEIMSS